MKTHTKKWERCFRKLKKEYDESSAAAICSSSIENGGLKSKHQRKNKKDYYSNKKKLKKFEDYSIDDIDDNIEFEYGEIDENQILRFDNFKLNEDAFTNNATYSGPSIVNNVVGNNISGKIVGSGSDGILAPNQTEIEGGEDQPTSTGEYPLKYKSTVKQVKTRDSRRRKSAMKKLQKLAKMSANHTKMKSFAEFNEE